MTPLIPVAEALDRLLSVMPDVGGSETVPLKSARGRIVAQDVIAGAPVPPWDNSAMDGYAVDSGTLRAGDELPVSQRIPAGTAGAALRAGTAARVFTGAPVPEGADAVIMQENCERLGERVRVLQAVAPGENIRRAGDDVSPGTVVVRTGDRVGPAQIGLMAACGVAQLKVRRRLKVAVMTTGDELRSPGSELAPGQIYNSNHFMLTALLETQGCEVIDVGIVGDSRQATVDALKRTADSDCIVSSGGVSVGGEDHVRAAVEASGRLDMWRLALKPGKPFAFGWIDDVPFFGLPGNPVSTFVTFVLIVRPCLLSMQGVPECLPREYRLPAGFSRAGISDREEYLRVHLKTTNEGQVRLVPFDNQSSGVLSSLAQADGLAIVPPGRTVDEGELLRFITFDDIVK